MPVRQRTTRHQRPILSKVQRALLRDRAIRELLDLARDEGSNPFVAFGPATEAELRRLWEAGGAEALRLWIQSHPGTRPSIWWRVVAPTIAGYTGEVPWRATRGNPDPARQRPILARLGVLEAGK